MLPVIRSTGLEELHKLQFIWFAIIFHVLQEKHVEIPARTSE